MIAPHFKRSPLDGLRWTLERGLRRVRIGTFSFLYGNWLRLRGVLIGRKVRFEGRVLIKGAHRIRIGSHTTVGRLIQLDTFREGYIDIGEHCFIGHFTIITADTLVTIGDRVLISPTCFISDINHGTAGNAAILDVSPEKAQPVNIGSGSWLGTMTTVVAGAQIGEGAVIGAGSLVNCPIPPLAIAVGRPAKVVKTRS